MLLGLRVACRSGVVSHCEVQPLVERPHCLAEARFLLLLRRPRIKSPAPPRRAAAWPARARSRGAPSSRRRSLPHKTHRGSRALGGQRPLQRPSICTPSPQRASLTREPAAASDSLSAQRLTGGQRHRWQQGGGPGSTLASGRGALPTSGVGIPRAVAASR